uniref:Uncharacterized protein n=1 Tax=Leptospira santarosai serovar Arenal str. MAVJ 401 TaxID=1049976 RepID=M6JJ35_9LEPT|nr:hypothetical protein LEP1GSC063_1536 [Leptospira santarosai serovar Arenal str. MAVJ 401]
MPDFSGTALRKSVSKPRIKLCMQDSKGILYRQEGTNAKTYADEWNTNSKFERRCLFFPTRLLVRTLTCFQFGIQPFLES